MNVYTPEFNLLIRHTQHERSAQYVAYFVFNGPLPVPSAPSVARTQINTLGRRRRRRRRQTAIMNILLKTFRVFNQAIDRSSSSNVWMRWWWWWWWVEHQSNCKRDTHPSHMTMMMTLHHPATASLCYVHAAPSASSSSSLTVLY